MGRVSLVFVDGLEVEGSVRNVGAGGMGRGPKGAVAGSGRYGYRMLVTPAIASFDTS